MKKILNSVLEEITPKDNKDIAEFTKILKKSIPKTANITIGGSFAKNTHIGENYDCDLFVQFKKSKKDISKELLAALKKTKQKIEVIHGSRDYYSINYKDTHFEIVPVLKLDKPSDAENIMDLSPFHVDWIKKELKRNKSLNNDIRLMKKLFKAGRVYGAESYIKGYSGHVVDILVLQYGGFKKTLQAISKWQPTTSKKFKKIEIDPNNYYKGKDLQFYMNKAKTESPLIVVDPIISDRNAAAALSDDCFDRSITLAKKFLKRASKDAFIVPRADPNSVRKKHKNVVVIEIEPKKGSEDVSGSKIMKAFEHIKREASKNGFEITFTDWFYGKPSHLFLAVSKAKIPATYWQEGPLVEMEDAVKAFGKKHKKTKVKKGRVLAEIKRKNTEFSSFMKKVIKDDYVTERVAKIKLS